MDNLEVYEETLCKELFLVSLTEIIETLDDYLDFDGNYLHITFEGEVTPKVARLLVELSGFTKLFYFRALYTELSEFTKENQFGQVCEVKGMFRVYRDLYTVFKEELEDQEKGDITWKTTFTLLKYQTVPARNAVSED